MEIKKDPNEHGIYPLSAINVKELNYNITGRIALVDADLLNSATRHPNLAIMKMAGYFKSRGCSVRLIEDYSELYDEKIEKVCFDDESELANEDGNLSFILDKTVRDYTKASKFDAIYISKVFDFSKIDDGLIRLPNVYIGGTGFFFDHAPDLPDEIEHFMPDYTIYDSYIEHDESHKDKDVYFKDYKEFSIGFATKGCFRQCEFCVNHNKKKVEFHSHISEWYDKDRKAIYLWDDNIFGYPHWKDVFDELAEIGKPFQFRQGMDLRLMTEEKAKVLDTAKIYGDLIFAFDHVEEAPIIEDKLKLWRKYTDRSTKLYVLTGFDSQDEKEVESVFYRISIIIKYGAFPYIMRHELYNKSPYKSLFTNIARWCNQPQFMRNFSFREFCEANQATHKTKGTMCSAMKAMTEFEAKFPKIAKKYFDMKFNEQKYVVKLKEKREKEKVKRDSERKSAKGRK